MGGKYDFVDISEDVDCEYPGLYCGRWRHLTILIIFPPVSDGDQFGAIDGYGKLPSLMIESDDELMGSPEGNFIFIFFSVFVSVPKFLNFCTVNCHFNYYYFFEFTKFKNPKFMYEIF